MLPALLLALACWQATPARSADTAAAGDPQPSSSASTPAAAGEAAFRYRIRIDAPKALRPLIEANVGLVRWQDFADMTAPLFDRLARDAVREATDAAASLGWFSAHATITVDTTAHPAEVVVALEPGEATHVRGVDIAVTGPATADSLHGHAAIAAARSRWRLGEGDVFTQAQWTQAKNGAVNDIAGAGYAAASIIDSEALIDPEARSADLAVKLASGPLFRVGEMRVRGLARYSQAMLENFRTLREGDVYDAAALDQFVRRLNNTGYFASVQAAIDTDPAHADAAPIDLAVIEAPTRRVDVGLGYSTDTRIRFNLSYRDVDFDDHARQLAIDARVEQLVSSLSVRVVAPPDTRGWINSVSAEAQRTDIENLVTETTVVGVRRRSLEERDNWDFGAAMYFDRQEPEGAGETVAHALYLDALRTWRRTDDLIAPTRGYNFALETGVGVPGASTRGFGRVVAHFAAWQPVTADYEASFRAEGGAVIADTRVGVPSLLLFRTGGDTSVRGYAFESLGVKDGDATVPGRYYAVASAELTRWVSANVGIATFVDAGNAVDEIGDLAHLAVGYGVGARLRTPIGPFRFDVAYGQDVHSVRLHFSVGLAF
jgi:translocation and assembly module TamA